MSGPTQVAATTSGNYNASCAEPTASPGDLIVATNTFYGATGATSTLSGTGWQLISRNNNTKVGQEIVTERWFKRRGTSAGGPYTAALSGGGADYLLSMVSYSGVSGAWPIGSSSVFSSNDLSVTPLALPSVTAQLPESYLYAGGSGWDKGLLSMTGGLSLLTGNGSGTESQQFGGARAQGATGVIGGTPETPNDTWAGSMSIINPTSADAGVLFAPMCSMM